MSGTPFESLRVELKCLLTSMMFQLETIMNAETASELIGNMIDKDFKYIVATRAEHEALFGTVRELNQSKGKEQEQGKAKDQMEDEIVIEEEVSVDEYDGYNRPESPPQKVKQCDYEEQNNTKGKNQIKEEHQDQKKDNKKDKNKNQAKKQHKNKGQNDNQRDNNDIQRRLVLERLKRYTPSSPAESVVSIDPVGVNW